MGLREWRRSPALFDVLAAEAARPLDFFAGSSTPWACDGGPRGAVRRAGATVAASARLRAGRQHGFFFFDRRRSAVGGVGQASPSTRGPAPPFSLWCERSCGCRRCCTPAARALPRRVRPRVRQRRGGGGAHHADAAAARSRTRTARGARAGRGLLGHALVRADRDRGRAGVALCARTGDDLEQPPADRRQLRRRLITVLPTGRRLVSVARQFAERCLETCATSIAIRLADERVVDRYPSSSLCSDVGGRPGRARRAAPTWRAEEEGRRTEHGSPHAGRRARRVEWVESFSKSRGMRVLEEQGDR